MRVNSIGQWINVLAFKTDTLNSISRTHMIKGEIYYHNLSSDLYTMPPHTHTHAYTLMHAHTLTGTHTFFLIKTNLS